MFDHEHLLALASPGFMSYYYESPSSISVRSYGRAQRSSETSASFMKKPMGFRVKVLRILPRRNSEAAGEASIVKIIMYKHGAVSSYTGHMQTTSSGRETLAANPLSRCQCAAILARKRHCHASRKRHCHADVQSLAPQGRHRSD